MKYNDFLVANETNLEKIAKNFSEALEETQTLKEEKEDNITETEQLALDILDGIEYLKQIRTDLKRKKNTIYTNFLQANEREDEEFKQHILSKYFDGKAQYREIDELAIDNDNGAKRLLNLILLGLILNSLNLFKRERNNENILNFATSKVEVLKEMIN